MSISFTSSQTKALGAERHLAITANAGSGKTRVLVNRYVDLFEKFDDLSSRNVVAITFTENAANQLRERVLKEVSDRLKTLPAEDHARRARLRALRDSLPSAFIGTIHAFAGRILHAYPVEANVDASFGILTGADQRLLVEDTIGTVFYSALDLAYESKDESPLLHLFRSIGRNDVTKLVRTLIGNRIRAEKLQKNLLAKNGDMVLSFWREELSRIISFTEREETKALFSQLSNYLKSGVKGQGAAALIQTYLSSSDPFESACSFYAASKKLITEKDPHPNSQSIDLKNLPESLLADLQDLIAFFTPLRSLLANSPDNEAAFLSGHREYLFLLRAVFDLYEQVLYEYTAAKTEYGLLDFDDLILTLQRLLENAQVRDELVKEFRFIMIDEFQDTDESQFELAKLLTENFGARNNLAIVGDPKQAIYTFRNADTGVFNRTKTSIAAQSLSQRAIEESIILGLLPEEESGSLSLGETFRMTRTPLAAINRLFRFVMSPEFSVFAEETATYDDLIHGRSAMLDGKVEWICPIAQKRSSKNTETNDEEETFENEAGSDESSEAELIARKIRSCVQKSDAGYQVESDNQLRHATWDDVAILLRSRTNLPLLERALRDEKIPYSVAKGSGFYSQQEILDISSYLSFLISDSNDIALAAILRSPFFAVSDVELFQIAHHESAKRRSAIDPWSFWDQFQSYIESHNIPHLLRASNQIRENLALAGRTSTAFIIEKIYAETAIFAALSDGRQGIQQVANLEKFLSQARASDASGFSGLFEFVERIRYLTDSEEQESQADAPDAGGAVRIMTVHAAKGLEFPIVVLPFLQKKFKFDYVRLLDKELGLQLKLPGSAEDNERKPLIAELIRMRSRTSTIEEEKRIFYVAATRARDHLIFSCTLPENPPKDSWLEWAAEAFGLTISSESLHFEEEIQRYDSDAQKASAEIVSFDIPLIRKATDIEAADESPIEKTVSEAVPSYFYPLQIGKTTGRFSATQLLRFRECPTKYHLSYILGMPEEPKLAYDLDEGAAIYSERVRGQLLGQVVHKVLDKIDRIAPNGILDENPFSHAVNAVFQSLGISDFKEQNKYSYEAHRHISKFLESPIAMEVISSSDSRSEFSLETLLNSGDTLFGIIDRLYPDANGVWTVLDYKTETSSDPKRKSKNLERYKFQLLFYSYLVHLMDTRAEKVRAVIFYSATGETTEFIFGPKDFGKFVTECSSIIQQIRVNEKVPDLRLLDRNTDHCPECSFFNLEKKCCTVLASG